MKHPQSSILSIVNLLAELTVYDSYTFDQYLTKLIQLLKRIIPVNSCLIYFFDREKKQLILSATSKKRKKPKHLITMKPGEGVTGWVLEHKEKVVLKRKAYQDPRFKLFPDLPEDRYEAFISIPIISKDGVDGVINLHNKEPYAFSADEVRILESVVTMIAAAFRKVALERKIDSLQQKLEERKLVEQAKGLLMKHESITEKKAFERIRLEAMKKRKSMREIAEAVVLLYD